MKIYMNGQEMDYTLENENNIIDVIKSIEDWLKKSQMLITKLDLDGKPYTYEILCREKNMKIDAVKKMEIEANHINDVHLVQINAVMKYLKKATDALDNSDADSMEDLLKDYTDIHLLLCSIFGIRDIDASIPELFLLDKIFAGTTAGMVRSWIQENKQEAMDAISQITIKLRLLQNEITNPLVTLGEVIQKLKNSQKDISNVSVLLQTGKDREAMQIIVNFSELTQSLLRIFTNIQFTKILHDLKFKNKTFDQFYTDFNKNLHELIEAFEKKDLVLIGDLLEYEIAPSIEEIIDVSEKLTKKSGEVKE